MLDPKNVLAPYIQGPGFNITVSAGSFYYNGISVSIPLTVVNLSSNTTNYIYLDLTSNLITSNTSGFAASGILPIATAITDNVGIKTLTDNRSDYFSIPSLLSSFSTISANIVNVNGGSETAKLSVLDIVNPTTTTIYTGPKLSSFNTLSKAGQPIAFNEFTAKLTSLSSSQFAAVEGLMETNAANDTPIGVSADSFAYGTGSTAIGVDSTGYYAGTSGTATNVIAYSGGAINESTGNVTNLVGSNPSLQNISTGTVTNAIFFWAPRAVVNSGGGTVTNAYGLKIEDQTVGTNKWAIKTGLGLVSFGDKVNLNGGSESARLSILETSNQTGYTIYSGPKKSSFQAGSIVAGATGTFVGANQFSMISTNSSVPFNTPLETLIEVPPGSTAVTPAIGINSWSITYNNAAAAIGGTFTAACFADPNDVSVGVEGGILGNSSSTITKGLYAGYFQGQNIGSGAVNIMRGVVIDNPVNSGGGSIVSNIALSIVSQTSGTSNFAISTGLGLVKFGDTVILATKTPSAANDTGTTGMVSWDASYIYVCVNTNTWKRVAISTWP